MGLKDKLAIDGSSYSKYDGGTPPVNLLATKDSPLHATPSGNPGYSLDGTLEPVVNLLYQEYDDGASNPLPRPTLLDRDKGQPYSLPTKYRNPETGATYP